jgi:hypothetical protein
MDASVLVVISAFTSEVSPSDTLQVGGLPLHPLLVHAVVVLAPLTALALLLGAFLPAARRRLGIVTLLAAAVLVVLVPITVVAGQSLKELVGPVPGLDRHAALGRMLLPWVIALFVVALAQWLWFRRASPDGRKEPTPREPAVRRRSQGTARVLSLALAVASVLVGVGTMVMVVLIGDAGSRAVWGGLLG